jgi:hypothetical protein
MRWKNKLGRKLKSPSKAAPRSLEGRMVHCLNCECDRPLTVNAARQMVCSVCAGHSWVHAATPLAAQFRDYDERAARREVEIDRVLNDLGRDFKLV